MDYKVFILCNNDIYIFHLLFISAYAIIKNLYMIIPTRKMQSL